MTQSKDTRPGTDATEEWNPFTGQRVFRSARAAWMIYGMYRFSISERTFYNYVGDAKACRPRADGQIYVEDVELFAQSKGWPPTSLFVRGAQKGGEGESDAEEIDAGMLLLRKRIKGIDLDNASKLLDLQKKQRELLPRSEYEQRLAAAAAVVGTAAETFVYDNVREIIYLCEGNPGKEDSLREFLLERVREWLHAFSRNEEYEVDFIEGNEADASSASPAEGMIDGTGSIN